MFISNCQYCRPCWQSAGKYGRNHPFEGQADHARGMSKNNIHHIKASHLARLSSNHDSHTMHFSSAITVAAVTLLISAIPVDAVGAEKCPIMCVGNGACKACRSKECVSISIFPGFDNESPDPMTAIFHLHSGPCFCFTSVQYCNCY